MRHGTGISRLLRTGAVLPVLAGVLAACGATTLPTTSSPDQPHTGGTLRIAMSAGNVPLPDVAPDQGYEGYRFVGNNIYDGLTRLNLDQSRTLPTPHPALATSWHLSTNHLTWTFRLRRGVTFQDGTRFDADAVIFNWRRDSDPTFKYYDVTDAAKLAAYFAHFRSYRKVNEYEVSITTKGPYAFLPYDLLTIFYASPAAVRRWGNTNYLEHATGTGPFRMTKYIDGQEMVLTANEHYWRGAPKLHQIVLYPEPESASRVASLEAGDVNWAEVPSPDALSQLKRRGFRIYLDNHHPGAIMPVFNEHMKPLDNVKVRRALNDALHRSATVAVINHTGLPAHQYVTPGNPAYVKGDPGYHYDPAEAKALLASAGYGPGKKRLTLRFAYPTGGSGNMFPEPMMEQLQEDFRAVNVDVVLVPMEWDALITIPYDGGLGSRQWSDIGILWSSPAAGMLPTGYATSFLCSYRGLRNVSGYCDPQTDRDYYAATRSFTAAGQHRYLSAMQRQALHDAAFLYWVYDRNLRVLAPTVHGYVQAQSWWVDFTKIWVS